MWVSPLRCLVLVIASVALSPNASAQAPRVNEYELTFGGLEERSVSVTVDLSMAGNVLTTDRAGPWFIPDVASWWELITVQEMSASDGKPVRMTGFSGSQARLD